ncbi:XopE/AvrPphe family type III secretion system effector (plasmid) [Ralstonia solanacearum P673]|uniref:XopE/AvrPphe family type III secretion system effector n=1 Tax=Ralstonia solanacearum TaxID=305 RepID=UPI00057E6842|nr:XopE/AvrPphe family type III secretion system effector [Ralstonia solanacearum]
MGCVSSKHSITSSTTATTVNTPERSEQPATDRASARHVSPLRADLPQRARRAGRRPLQLHEVQQVAYQLGMRVNGSPIESPRDRQRLADATATVHETRLALKRGRGNVDSDLRLSGGRSASYTALSYVLGEGDDDALAGSALAAGAGNCVRMEDGGQMMTVRDSEATHVYALYQPPPTAEGAAGGTGFGEHGPAPMVVLDSWADGPAVLLRHSHWAEGYGQSTEMLEQFDKPAAADALARANAFKGQIENPQTSLHAEACKWEAEFLRNPTPGAIYGTMPVIDPALAESVRRTLAEYSPRSQRALAADAAQQAYGLSVEQANAPQLTAAILEDAKRLDSLGRPALEF